MRMKDSPSDPWRWVLSFKDGVNGQGDDILSFCYFFIFLKIPEGFGTSPRFLGRHFPKILIF